MKAEVHVRLSSNHSFTNNLLFVEKENVAITASVKNILIGSTLTPLAVFIVDLVEDYGVRRKEAVRAPISFLIRILPERDNAKDLGIASNSWFLLLQLSVTVLDKSKVLAIDSFSFVALYFARFISLVFSDSCVLLIASLLGLY